jgi:hypothetical protein
VGAIPYNINIPTNKDFLINITNNDQTNLTLPNNNNLTLVVNRDLDSNQTMEVNIDANTIGSENKKLNIYINYSQNNGAPVLTSILENINLPIYYNKSTKTTNSAYNWDAFKFNIDINSPIRLNTGSFQNCLIDANPYLVANAFKSG